MKEYKIAIIGALSEKKFRSKVEPLIALEEVEKVYIFRRTANPVDIKYASKIIYKHSSLPKYLFYLASLFSIFFLGLSGKINLIVAIYFFPYGIIAGMAGSLSLKPVIQILPGSDMNKIINERIFLGMLRRSFKIGARGNNSVKAFMQLGIEKEKLFVLQNTFDLPSNKNLQQEKKWDIIFIGYLRKPKRIDVTVEVIEKLKKNIPNISCVIIGDGPEYNNIQNMIVTKGLENNIEMAGHQDNIDDYIARSRVFLLTSESEGLPMVLVEALTFGLPVVTSDINDISDLIIDGKNGFLIPSLKIEDYVAAVEKVMNDKKLYDTMSANGKILITEFHTNSCSFDAVQKTWQELLNA